MPDDQRQDRSWGGSAPGGTDDSLARDGGGVPSPGPLPGDRLPSPAGPEASYELVEIIGRGGMGRVFRAVHHPYGTEVAVKTLRSAFGDERSRRLLLREATAAAQLRHPRIVELVDLTRTTAGSPALVMELVAGGQNLAAWRTDWPGWDAVDRGLRDVLEGLAAAHAAGIVHRDLKPENLLLDATGRVKIADFGVAQVQNPLRRRRSRDGVVGTPAYMAPEQFVVGGEIGPWTDLYAIGVLLYQLLSAGSPYRGADLGELLEAKMAGRPIPRPLRRGLDVPFELLELATGLIRPDPRLRPRFAADVGRAIGELSRSVVDSSSVPSRPRGVAPASSSMAEGAPPSPLHGDETVLDATIPAVAGDEQRREPSALARLRAVPLVGRQRERAALTGLVDAVIREGRSRALALVGPTGAGKSALARWGLGEVERLGLMEGAAAGYSFAGSAATGGLRHAVGRLVGRPVGRPARESGQWPRAWSWLWHEERDEGEPPFDADVMTRWVAEDPDNPVPVDQDPLLAHAALSAASRARPLYLWLDDAGWSLDGALDLVERLLGDPRAAVAIVLTLRSGTAEHPDVRAQLARILEGGATEEIELEPLGEKERRELLSAVVPFQDSVAEELARQMTGTPLLMVQRVHDWLDRGLLSPGTEGFTPVEGMSVEELLAERSLDALVAGRVEGFLEAFGDGGPIAEGVLLRAAVLGVDFEERALHACCDADKAARHAMDAVLDDALLHGLLRTEREGAGYRFDHGLVQENLLDRLRSHPDRRAILRDTAAGMAAIYERSRPDIGRRAAELLLEAGDLEPAVTVVLAAAASMAHMGSCTIAAECIADARRWIDDGSVPREAPLRGALLYCDAQYHYFTMRYDESLHLLRQATSIFETAGDRAMQGRARHLESGLLFFQDRFAEAERLCRALLDDLEPGEHELKYLTAHRLVQLGAIRDDFAETERLALAAREAAKSMGVAWRVRMAEVTLAETELALGEVDKAAGRIRATIAASEPAGDVAMAGEALDLGMWVDLLRGRLAAVRRRLAKRLPEALRSGDAWRTAFFRTIAALVEAEEGGDEEAEAAAGAVVDAFEEATHDEPFTRWALERAVVLLRERGLDEAAGSLREVHEARRRAVARGFEESD